MWKDVGLMLTCGCAQGRCVSQLQEAGLKVLADIVINHRCAHAQVSDTYCVLASPALCHPCLIDIVFVAEKAHSSLILSLA